MKHIIVAAAVIIESGKVFAAQRDDQGETGNLWEFPGGKLEQGESGEKAIVREIAEELQLQISVERYLMTVNHQYSSFMITMHAYLCSIHSGKLTLHEHVDYKWLEHRELKSLDWAPADKPIVTVVSQLLSSL
jgi:8-oxo-dGTP diphosphatase